ncbi:MAG TPA: MASE1 domain-containing protein [Opitutaceae bacterium]|nr:MASE1 domain-containing protein [Opitutaceae bacterium]
MGPLSRLPRALWARALLFGVGLFILAQASWLLAERDGSDVSFWLPAGYSISVLMLSESSEWLILMAAGSIGNIIFDAMHGTAMTMTLAYALLNTLQALLGAFLYRKLIGRGAHMKTMKELLGLVAYAALLSSAVIGVAMAATGVATGEGYAFVDGWLVGWSSNAMSIVTVAPLILVWASPPEAGESWWREPRRLAEMAILATGLTIFTVVAFGGRVPNAEKFTLIPFILWAALRFGMRGASMISLLAALLVVYLAAHGPEIYTVHEIISGASVLKLDAYLTICAMVGLIPALAVAERDTLVQQLGNSEARFRNLTEAAFEGVFITENGLIVDVNDQGLQLLGYERAEVMGTPVADYVSAESREVVAENIRNERELAYRHKMVRKDGTKFDAEARAKMMQMGSRTVRMTALRDISGWLQDQERRMHLEEQLRQTQKLEALGTLAGGIAHDFNNILTGILGNLQLTELELAVDDPAHETLAASVQACRRARDLVARILSFSRLEHDNRVAAQLGATVMEAVQLLKVGLQADIEIRVNLAKGTPAVVFDPSQIHQVVMNLGTNSIQAIKGGGVLSIDLEAVVPNASLQERHPQVEPRHTVRLKLRDSGCGMDETVLKRVFEPFFTTKAGGGGTGLGLAMVHAIIKSHDGAIVIESLPRVGTTFEIFFPPASGADLKKAGSTTVLKNGDFAPFGRGRRIMLVDDQDEVRVTGSILLKKLGFVPSAYASPADALADFRKAPSEISAVISDLTMPEMTGVELAERVLAARPGTPIIIASGYLPPETKEKFLALGVSSLIGKPFELREITERVRSVVGP